MTNDKMKSEIREIVSNLTQIPKEDIDDKESFANVGVNSFSLIEIVYAVENKYEIDIPQNKLVKVSNFDELVELIKSLLPNHE